jgi:hypothetical protein
MKEKDFCKNKITPWLKKQGIYYFKPRGGVYSSRRGIPDYCLCIQGRFIGLEVKTDKGQLSALQEIECEAIDRAGGHWSIVRPRTWESIKQYLLRLQK